MADERESGRITVPIFLVPLLSNANLDCYHDEDIRAVLRKLDDRARRRVGGFCKRVARISDEVLP